MSSFADLNTFLDPHLIWAFRLVPDAQWGFFVGCVYVALCTILLGDVAMVLAYRINRKPYLAQRREMQRHNDLSFQALLEKDKKAFKACNILANESFGKNFFLGATMFCASIWPMAIALGWLDYRFGRVEDLTAPFIGAVRPEFWFIPIYIGTRFLFSKIKHYIPLYSRLHALARADEAALESEQLLRAAEAKAARQAAPEATPCEKPA
ncbi:hypothetical protein [Megalodesulfovibrio paquesii]